MIYSKTEQLPQIEHQAIMLVGDPRVSAYRGPRIATWIKWPSLGVSILHSLTKQEAGT